jgi:hypothetical protein
VASIPEGGQDATSAASAFPVWSKNSISLKTRGIVRLWWFSVKWRAGVPC